MLEQISACLEDISNTQLNARRVRDNPPFFLFVLEFMPTKWRNAGSDFLQFFYCTIKKRKCKGRRETGRKGINIVFCFM